MSPSCHLSMGGCSDGLMFLGDANDFMDDYSLMVASDKFAPLSKLYSTGMDLTPPSGPGLYYKPVPRQHTNNSLPDQSLHHQNPGSQRGVFNPKTPTSPLTEEGPRSVGYRPQPRSGHKRSSLHFWKSLIFRKVREFFGKIKKKTLKACHDPL